MNVLSFMAVGSSGKSRAWRGGHWSSRPSSTMALWAWPNHFLSESQFSSIKWWYYLLLPASSYHSKARKITYVCLSPVEILKILSIQGDLGTEYQPCLSSYSKEGLKTTGQRKHPPQKNYFYIKDFSSKTTYKSIRRKRREESLGRGFSQEPEQERHWELLSQPTTQ